MDPTKYRHIFGEPKKGVHSKRLLGIALVDLGLTALAAYIIAIILKANPLVIFVGLIILGIGIHGFFGVDTELNRWLGLTKKEWVKK